MTDTEVIVTTYTCHLGFVRTIVEWSKKEYATVRQKLANGVLSYYHSNAPLLYPNTYYTHIDFPNKIFKLIFDFDGDDELDYVKLVEVIPIPIKAIQLC